MTLEDARELVAARARGEYVDGVLQALCLVAVDQEERLKKAEASMSGPAYADSTGAVLGTCGICSEGINCPYHPGGRIS